MRVFNVQSIARPLPFDRNPLAKGAAYNTGSVAPHGNTQRWSYTVPAGKKAYAQSVLAKLIRDTVATTGGLAQAFINYTPSGGSSQTVCVAQNVSTAIGNLDAMAFGLQMEMFAGDQLAGNTNDPSTAGSYNYSLNWTGFEFDL